MGVDQRRREARSRGGGGGGGGGNGRDGGRRCDLNQKDRTYRTRGTYSTAREQLVIAILYKVLLAVSTIDVGGASFYATCRRPVRSNGTVGGIVGFMIALPTRRT